MSLLTMVTQVCRRIGITAPSSVSSSSDPQIVQLMAIANEEGQDLSSRYPWVGLQNESTFATVATESQGAILTLAGASFRYILSLKKRVARYQTSATTPLTVFFFNMGACYLKRKPYLLKQFPPCF